MRVAWGLVAIGAAWSLSGCGENCRSTCTHVYAESECNIVLFGVTPDNLIDECVRECESALQHVGEQRFEPSETPASDDAWTLENEAEAAAWMDCVWSQVPEEGPSPACANIDPAQGGICAPI